LRDLHLTIAIGAGDGVASVDRYIEHLCESLCDGLLTPRGIQCEVRVEPGFLPSQVCERLGLIIVELVTNSMKHAFPDRDSGLVRVEMVRDADCWLLTVSDDGVGFRDQRSGTGLEMVHLLARAAGADVVFAPRFKGVTVAISVPAIDFQEADFPPKW
ncbi:MAG TPA: sensor histidine kinase, partial [Terriglobales bacterium]|nr:sensor histidine kinase [Terriglobales bacterium]